MGSKLVRLSLSDTFALLVIKTSGLYIKLVMIAKDTSRIVSERRHNLERHSRIINYNPTGIINAQDVYNTDITYGDCH
jgi:hypothetical protein